MTDEDALLSFLDGREGFIAHINEINNDRGLREVMAAQPKPMMAINKAVPRVSRNSAMGPGYGRKVMQARILQSHV
eukprot:s1482_g1.t1